MHQEQPTQKLRTTENRLVTVNSQNVPLALIQHGTEQKLAKADIH